MKREAMLPVCGLIVWLSAVCAMAQTPLPPASKLSEEFSVKNGPSIQTLVARAAELDTPLLVLGLFEYPEGETLSAAHQELNRKLNGLLDELRQSGRFSARPLETLLLTPLPYSIRPRRVLLIGLGEPKALSLDLIQSVGRVAAREALRLGVQRYAQTFDAPAGEGFAEFSSSEITRHLLEGALAAYDTEGWLQERGFADQRSLTQITFVSLPERYEATVQGAKQAIGNYAKRIVR